MISPFFTWKLCRVETRIKFGEKKVWMIQIIIYQQGSLLFNTIRMAFNRGCYFRLNCKYFHWCESINMWSWYKLVTGIVMKKSLLGVARFFLSLRIGAFSRITWNIMDFRRQFTWVEVYSKRVNDIIHEMIGRLKAKL